MSKQLKKKTKEMHFRNNLGLTASALLMSDLRVIGKDSKKLASNVAVRTLKSVKEVLLKVEKNLN